MKTIKSIANLTLSIAIALLSLQAVLALVVKFIPASQLAELESVGVSIAGDPGLANLYVLLIHNALWIFGLFQIKTKVKTFQKSDVITVEFAHFLKKTGALLLVAELLSSYLATVQAPAGTYIISVEHGIYFIVAGFSCEYGRRYMAKKGLSI